MPTFLEGLHRGDIVQTSLLRYEIESITPTGHGKPVHVGRLIAGRNSHTGLWADCDHGWREDLFRSGEWEKVDADDRQE